MPASTTEQPYTVDEWTFSIRTTSGTPLVLQRAQPVTQSSLNLRQLIREEEGDDESVSLLNSDSLFAAHGWTFTTPFWSLHSQSLLTVTYMPAYQALPEYTRATCGCMTYAACACCQRMAQVDYYSYTYKASDVVRSQSVPELVVAGVGKCKAIKLYLKPMELNHDFGVPDYLQEAWQRQLENIERSRGERSSTTTNSSSSSSNHSSKPKVGPILTFCIPNQNDPPLLWNVSFPNCNIPIAIESLSVLDGALVLDTQMQPSPTHIYINGWQSWSFAGSIPRGKPQPQPALPNVFSRAFNYGASVPPPAECETTDLCYEPFVGHYQSDFFTCITSDGQVPQHSRLHLLRKKEMPYQQLDEMGGPAMVLGWLSNRRHFGLVSANKCLDRFQMHLSAHGQLMIPGVTASITSDWAYAQLLSPHSYDEEPLVHYLHSVAAVNEARPLMNGSLLTGWCSWYFAYEKISEKLLSDNFAKLAVMRTNVPTNVSVVDDGYMTAWGDWDSVKPRQFPRGMKVVSEDIASYGMRPGLWMAPFAADKHSQIVKDHPEWIIRNHDGMPANSSNCGKFFYGLDATNPEVRAHAFRSVKRAVEEWGFNVLKIDFLYAACLEGNGKFDLSMSRAEAMHLALQTIRDAAGQDTFLIGCGCPIATGIGFVDAMRVSADTGPTWYPAPPLPWWDMGTLPSLRAMVRNSVSRAPLGHRWWHNDPDCLMFGEHTRLTDDEVASAASIVAMTCGMLLLSDDLPKVPANRMTILSKIFPLTGVTAVVLDLHSTNNGLPSLLRLWCTDRYDVIDDLRQQMSFDTDEERDHNAEATYFARQASFRPNSTEQWAPDERRRSCIHVTKGLGTWTVVSISNWLDKADVVQIPPPALLPAPKFGWEQNDGSNQGADVDVNELRDYAQFGYHVFAFWSSKYSWLPKVERATDTHTSERAIIKYLPAHATEIFHIKPVTPDAAQYIGSDLHFSCGQEVRSFRTSRNGLKLRLNTDYQRVGRVFVFIPRANTDNLRVVVSGQPGRWNAVGNTPKVHSQGASSRLVGRVVSIAIVVKADGTKKDGLVEIEY